MLPALRGDAVFAKNAAGAAWESDFGSLGCFFGASRAFATEPCETYFSNGFRASTAARDWLAAVSGWLRTGNPAVSGPAVAQNVFSTRFK